MACDNPPKPWRKAVEPFPYTPTPTPTPTPPPLVTPAAAQTAAPPSPSGASRPAPVEPPVALADLTLPTLSTYEQVCARCHGPQGMFHWAQVASVDAAILPEKIHQMMTQQGQLSPTPADEAAMLAYHHAMHDVGPGGPLFMVALNAAAFAAGTAPELKGEATPGAMLTWVDAAGAEQPVALKGSDWSLSASPAAPFELRAALDGKTTTLRFPEAGWSR